MKEIGVQKTALDSAALKENIALSMADVLTYNSSVFVKSFGRATLSTVAFRGTSPGHTQVTWNGMRINSPMLGMTDFSTIPAYFIDRATLLHGTSSVNESGGGLGGLVSLATQPSDTQGFKAQYTQGVGSFRTFDEYARVSYADSVWSVTTRAVCSSSPNDYPYINHDKKLNIYDDDRNIIGQYYPRERNRSGAYRDIHLLQEAYYNAGHGNRLGANVWYVNSNRELPMLSTDYGYEADFENRQREQTLRALLSWDRRRSSHRTSLKAGYIYTYMAYDYRREAAKDVWTTMTRSRSNVNSLFARADGEWSPAPTLYLTATTSAYNHHVRSRDKDIILTDGTIGHLGYDRSRLELSGALSAKWQPTQRVGLSLVTRAESYGSTIAPIIPALFADVVIIPDINLMVRGSMSRNYRFPSLNDMYFLPGGNPDLRPEQGFTYDCGTSMMLSRGATTLSGSVTWFDSRIDDWILWLPATRGFFSPRNVKSVHSYGIEAKGALSLNLPHRWMVDLNGTFAWTPSINVGTPLSDADRSVGKQLPYVPLRAASLTARVGWRSWAILYKWSHYSERFTMSSNDTSLTGTLPPYFMNNVTLEKGFTTRLADLQIKFAVNNLLNEDYVTVLSRPMPGINFELFLSILPKF